MVNTVSLSRWKWLFDIFQDMHGENIVLVNAFYGAEMPDGMKENDKFPTPILTPTTKADVGHDEDISREEILGHV